MKPTILAAVLLGLALSGEGARAQSAPTDAAFATTTLRLSAFGEARATPDLATMSLGVETTDSTAGGAMRANAARMSAVLAALTKSGIAERDVQTSSLNLTPQYVYEQNRPPRLTGYQASNQVSVTVRDLSRLGPAADAVVAGGATNVGQISFGLANPAASEDSARVAAVKALEDKAALYARTAGYQVKRLVNLAEGGGYTPGPPRPTPMLAMRASAEPTPVEAGELKVRIDVTGLFELSR